MALLDRLRLLWLALTMPPIRGADDGDDDAGKDDGAGKDDADKDDKADADKDDDEKVDKDDDWKSKSRKNESRAKRAERERDEARAKLKEQEDADKSEQQKAIDKAREEARNEALSEAEKDRRSDRLEVAVTRLATKGIKIGDGDEAKTLRFADAEDALLRVERQIARGDLDSDEIYDSEGKVNTDALTTALADILRTNSHLVADGAKAPASDNDARKGEPADSDLEAMSPEDHAKAKYPAK